MDPAAVGNTPLSGEDGGNIEPASPGDHEPASPDDNESSSPNNHEQTLDVDPEELSNTSSDSSSNSSSIKDDRSSLHRFLQDVDADNDSWHVQLSEWKDKKDEIGACSRHDSGFTPLHVAVNRQLSFAVDWLLKQEAPVSTADSEGLHPLHYACIVGNQHIAQLLLGRGAEIDPKGIGGSTPLDLACYYGHLAVVELLLDRKANTQVQDNSGWSPLRSASECGYVTIIERLLKKNKGNIDDVDNNQHRTAFHAAIYNGNIDTARCLLKEGADINKRDDDGRTPLMTAILSRQWKAVDLLLVEMTAENVNAGDKDGKTALHHASWVSAGDVEEQDADQLSSEERGSDSASQKAQSAGSSPTHLEKVVQLLLKKGADPGKKTKDKETALHFAARHSDLGRVQEILNKMKDKDLSVQDSQGRTALRIACQARQYNIVQYLLKRLGNVDSSNTKIEEVLMWASGNSDTHDIAEYIFTKIKELGNGPKPSDSDTWHAIEWAAYLEMPGVLWNLLSTSRPTRRIQETQKKALDRYDDSEKGRNGVGGTKSNLESNKPRNRNKYKQYETQGQEENQNNRILVGDILRDPPFTQTSRHKEPFEVPEINQDPGTSVQMVVQNFNAAIIEFYEGQGGSGMLKRFRSVKDVIYDKGPTKIMKETKKAFEKLQLRREDEGAPKFTWTHLPATNLIWMNDLLKRTMKDKGYTDDEFHKASLFFRTSWVEIPDRTSRSRFMRPQTVKNQNHRYTAIYMPYLTFSKEFDGEKIQEEQSRKEHQEYTELIKLEEAKTRYDSLLKAYEGRVVHGSPTLDESYYHFASDEKSRKDQRYRNKHQVVTKRLSDDEKYLPFWTLLRVNQLWVWVIGENDLITATTHPVDQTEDPVLTDILEYVRQAGYGGGQAQPNSATEMSKMIVDYCIGLYGREMIGQRETRNRENESIRQIFSYSINNIAIDESTLFGKFATQKEANKEMQQSSEEIRAAIEEAARLSCDIKDIRDELNILKTIARYQETVQKQMDPKRSDTDPKGINADHTATRIMDDISEMEKAANRIQSAVETTLSLEQSEIANAQTSASVRQGRILMVFTLITSIFLPLSFLSSLFALDAASFQQTPAWAFLTIFLGSGLVVALIAFYFRYSNYPARIWRYAKEIYRQHIANRGQPDDPTENHGGSGSVKGKILGKPEPGASGNDKNPQKADRQWKNLLRRHPRVPEGGGEV